MGIALEARETGDLAPVMLARTGPVLADLGQRLRARPPSFVMTCGRGSSDHAATFGKYLLETRVGCVVASGAPSVSSIYGRPLVLADALVVAVSQSGRTPDVVEMARAARRAGALVVAFVNDERSPLAEAAELVVPLCAGPEHAVAATKSFLLACLAFIDLASRWADDAELRDAVSCAPDLLSTPTSVSLAPLALARSVYVVARGLGTGAALEIALKLKETCVLHAEAFSAAELQHGPIALVEPGFPVVGVVQDDGTAAGTHATLDQLATLGAHVIEVPVPAAPPALQVLAAVQSCYLALPALAALRGFDADLPRNLRKVTETR
jgi:glucosamine--fructose-6-phosphate aminotransferase (isomerizing)